jgi:Icc-related predicted phosphoesterase
MCRKIYSTILVIPGNHDRCFEHLENECRRLVEEVDRTFLLIDRTIDIDGVKFYGSPWTPWFYGDVWSFNIPEKEGAAKAIWEKIPADTDVVITHGPPYGIRDYCDRHAGCSVLGSRILEIKPRAHIFGHIHEGAGQSLIDSTLYVNAAFMDKGSGPQVSEVTK